MPSPSFTFKTYKNAVLVSGSTRQVKQLLKDLGGLWRPNLGEGGWMFPSWKKAKVEESLKGHIPCNIIDEAVGQPDQAAAAESGKAAAGLKKEDKGGVKKKPARAADVVDRLCSRFSEHGTDTQVIRAILPEALHALSAPRTNRGGEGDKMTARARQELNRRDQPRLRTLVRKCLLSVWESWKSEHSTGDGDLLQESVDHILDVVRRYESAGETLEHALAGDVWVSLRDLVTRIADSMKEGEGSKATITHVGKGTLALVMVALEKLGGSATAAEIKEWVGKHKDSAGTATRLNEHPTAATDRPKGMKTWELTVSGCLSKNRQHFEKTSEKKGGAPLWRLLRYAPPVAIDGSSRKRPRLA